MIYLQLFITFFKIGLFSIGGGYAAIPLIENEIVNMHHYLSATEFADIIVIAGMTPGPIAINAATFVGIKVAGFFGSVVCLLGCIFPSFIIVLALFYVYKKYKKLALVQGVIKGLKPAIVALIASASISLTLLAICDSSSFVPQNFDIIGCVICLVSFVLLRKWKVDPIILMVIMGVVGMVIYLIV